MNRTITKILPIALLFLFFTALVTFGLLTGLQAGKNKNQIESDFGMIYRNINQNLPKSTGFSDPYFIQSCTAILKDTTRIGYFYITNPQGIVVFAAAKNKAVLGSMKKPGQKLVPTTESSGIFALDFDSVLENTKIKNGYHLLCRGYYFYSDEVVPWLMYLFIFSLIVLFLYAIPLLIILLDKKEKSIPQSPVNTEIQNLNNRENPVQNQETAYPQKTGQSRFPEAHLEPLTDVTTDSPAVSEDKNQYQEIPMPEAKLEPTQMLNRLADRGITFEADDTATEAAIPLIEENNEESYLADIPDLTNEGQNTNGTPEGLYSERTGFGWEAYLAARLDNELSRSAAFDQDLVACVVCYKQDSENEEDFRSFASRIRRNFEYRDLIFEFEADKFFLILPNINSDQGVRRIENFFSFLEKNFPQHYEKVSAGLTSRHGRLVSASRLIKEAISALARSVPVSDKSIIAFKPDPDKYRNLLAGIN